MVTYPVIAIDAHYEVEKIVVSSETTLGLRKKLSGRRLNTRAERVLQE